jgi:hypothetical protein
MKIIGDMCIYHVVALAPEPNPIARTRRQLSNGSENLNGDETKPSIARIPYRGDLNSDDRPVLKHGSEIFEDCHRGGRRSVLVWLQTWGFKRAGG